MAAFCTVGGDGRIVEYGPYLPVDLTPGCVVWPAAGSVDTKIGCFNGIGSRPVSNSRVPSSVRQWGEGSCLRSIEHASPSSLPRLHYIDAMCTRR